MSEVIASYPDFMETYFIAASFGIGQKTGDQAGRRVCPALGGQATVDCRFLSCPHTQIKKIPLKIKIPSNIDYF